MALQEFEGALVLVSHDRYLLRSVADEFYLIADGGVEPYQGDLDEYRRWLSDRRQRQKALQPDAPPSPSTPAPRQLSRQEEAENRKRQKSLTTAMERAERQMNQAGDALRQIEEKLASEDLYLPESRSLLEGLVAERDALAGQLQAAEHLWLESSEALEALTA